MDGSLFLKYRPTEFSGIVGQDLSALALHRMVELKRVPQALLFVGPSGTGKTSAARILGSALGFSPSQVIEVDAASNRGVDNIRTLTDSLRFSGDGRLIILDEAHNLTREAFNALLKTLEEPAPGVYFVLLTTESHKIPDTVKSRLMEFEFRRISTADVYERLSLVSSEESIGLGDDILWEVAQDSDGNLRSALVLLEKVQSAGVTTVEEYKRLIGSIDFAPRLLHLMTRGDYSAIFDEIDSLASTLPSPSIITAGLLNLYTDLLRLRSGGDLKCDEEARRKRQVLSVEITREQLMTVVRLIWDLRTKLRQSDDPRGNLEMGVILMTDVLSAGREVKDVTPQVSAPAVDSRKKLSLAEMRA